MKRLMMGLLMVGVLGACSSDDDSSASGGSGATGATGGTGGSGGAGASGGAGGTAGSGGAAGAGGGGPCVCSVAHVVNCGHRGNGKKADFPENTVESAQLAFAAGADMVEIDVLHSADGQVILMHDDTIERTTTGTGCVGDMTVAEIQAFDAAEGTTLEGTGVVAPTLAELLAGVDGQVNIEIKATGGPCPVTDRPLLAQDIVAIIQADTKTRRIVLSSFDEELLTEVQKVDATLELGLLALSPLALDTADGGGFQAFNLAHAFAGEEILADVRSRGMDLNVWTANGIALGQMLDLGVDMIITDEPGDLATMIDERCAMECPGE